MNNKNTVSYARAPRGTGRCATIRSIRIPDEVKERMDTWKKAYERKMGQRITYEEMLNRWMDNIGRPEQWDEDIKKEVDMNTENYINDFGDREKLICYLNSKGRFWEYNNKADTAISDTLLITKSLLFLEFEDMPQLFRLFGKQKCKRIFLREIKSKGKYYSTISFLLNSIFFSSTTH